MHAIDHFIRVREVEMCSTDYNEENHQKYQQFEIQRALINQMDPEDIFNVFSTLTKSRTSVLSFKKALVTLLHC